MPNMIKVDWCIYKYGMYLRFNKSKTYDLNVGKKMYEYFFQEIKNEVKVHKRESDKEMIDYYDTHNTRRWLS